jgi:hypothetical protein
LSRVNDLKQGSFQDEIPRVMARNIPICGTPLLVT